MTRALVATALIVAMAGFGPTPARAAHTGQSMLTSVSGDPLAGGDNTVRLSEWGGQCALDYTHWARLNGSMQPPVPVTFTWVFDTPNGVLDGTNCPDTGEVVDLHGDGTLYVVAGWSEGPPPGVGGNLMIIDPGVVPCDDPFAPFVCTQYPPSTGARVNVDGALRPSFVGGGEDFDGDGSVDVYEVDRETSEVITLLTQPDGSLSEGPMRLPGLPNGSVSNPTDGLAFGDFDGDGATDLVADYALSSDPARPDGVAVVLDDGTHVQLLERDEDPTRWNLTLVDEDEDGNLDVRAERHGFDVRLFLGDGAGGLALATCNGQTANVVGTKGADVILGFDGPDVIAAFGGDDDIKAWGGDDLICGGAGNDGIDGNIGSDFILGGSGNDFILGGSGNDLIMGGDDGDYIVSGDGDDYVSAGLGDDVVYGGIGLDWLYGGGGADDLQGGGGADYLSGGVQNDRLVGGFGDDSLVGGAQVDDCAGGAGTNSFSTCESIH